MAKNSTANMFQCIAMSKIDRHEAKASIEPMDEASRLDWAKKNIVFFNGPSALNAGADILDEAAACLVKYIMAAKEKKTEKKILVRLPEDVAEQVEARAEENNRSINAEIVEELSRASDAEKAPAAPAASMPLEFRRISEIFDFGFEEMHYHSYPLDKDYCLTRKDFENDMKKFWNYSIERFRREFSAFVWFD